MLTELKLSNFRIFNDEVTVRFRPITVLIGRNSSGKSSIVKFLLMLQQSVGPGKSGFLSPEGDSVRLGSFPELKNSISRKRNLTFDLVCRTLPNRPTYFIWEHFGLSEHSKHKALFCRTNVTLSYSAKTSMGYSSYSLMDGMSNRNLIRTDTKILDDSTFLDNPNASAIASELKDTLENSGYSSALAASKGALEIFLQLFQNQDSSVRRYMLEHELLDILRYQLASTRHISPVRDESGRVIVVASPPVDYVGQRGQYVLPHLQQMIADRNEAYEFILPHMKTIADIESITFDTSLGHVSRAFAKSRTTGADVLITDYGFGVSQCLPIFVQGAIMAPFTFMMVEEPEAQLHPTAQLEMGSFFADLWRQRKVGSIIETHSRNILLRIRRLIANGELSHKDVSVAYFTVEEDMPIVKNLDINEDGSMEAGLPMEFFGADIMEGLKLGART